MNVLSLFSGIGGLELGLERAGMTVVGQVEIDPFCRQVLAKHWPEVPRHDDVRTAVEWWASEDRPAVDVICGGFPCQDISNAGKREGITGARSGLWSAMRDTVRALRPRYVVMENVAAILVRGLDVVAGDLAEIGYDLEWDCIPAAAVGAPHRRDRWWGIAHPNTDSIGFQRLAEPDVGTIQSGQQASQRNDAQRLRAPMADADRPRRTDFQRSEAVTQRAGWRAPGRACRWHVEPQFRRMVNGISKGLDGAGLNADAAEAGPAEGLLSVRSCDDPATVGERSTGGSVGVLAPEILQSAVHGGGATQRQSVSDLHAEVSQGRLRELWKHIATRGASQGRGSDEQLTRELADALRDLPHNASLGKREAEQEAARYVLGLRSACTQAGFLRDPSHPLSEAWQSLSCEAAHWVHLAACGGPWVTEWPDTPRVATGVPRRVDRLKSLGNAVVPQVSEHIGRLIVNVDHERVAA